MPENERFTLHQFNRLGASDGKWAACILDPIYWKYEIARDVIRALAAVSASDYQVGRQVTQACRSPEVEHLLEPILHAEVQRAEEAGRELRPGEGPWNFSAAATAPKSASSDRKRETKEGVPEARITEGVEEGIASSAVNGFERIDQGASGISIAHGVVSNVGVAILSLRILRASCSPSEWVGRR